MVNALGIDNELVFDQLEQVQRAMSSLIIMKVCRDFKEGLKSNLVKQMH